MRALVFFGLAACVAEKPPGDTADPCAGVVLYADADGDGFGDDGRPGSGCDLDGYVSTGGDCDDAAPAVRPGAPETCDGVDEDCDGAIDEGDAIDPSTFYADTDGDGFGDAASTTRACAAPEGHVADATDCDDADATEFPGAAEVCDGDDDDCDFQVDEDDATDAPTWYADLDADGYGDAGTVAVSCHPPPRHVSNAADCDDGDARRSPDASERCDGEDDDCDGVVDEDAIDAPTWYTDLDADGFGDPGTPVAACALSVGFTDDASDCDDDDGRVNPAATEICDGVDDDCDGTVDEPDAADAPPWYADADGDGHGDAGVVTAACTEPAGYVASAADCDDTDATISPDATERCDDVDVDEDCDGLVDDADSGALDPTTWYSDADADGYGDPAVTTSACAAPAAHVANAEDCDDTSAAVSPAADETCDEVDDDCDGAVDDADDDVVGAPSWYTDADADGWGDGVAAASCEAPAGAVADEGDCDDTDDTVSPDAEEICGDGVDQDCNGADASCSLEGAYGVADADLTLYGEGYRHYAGRSLAGGGDLDGDGYDDVLISANDSVYIAMGPLAAGTLADVPARSTSTSASDDYGDSVTIGPDFDGDGTADWAAGARYADGGGASSGEVYLFSGAPAAASTRALDEAAHVFVGAMSGDFLGCAVALLPSLDGDGYGELLVGAYGESPLSGGAGVAYLFSGPTTGSVERAVSTADAVLVGEAADDYFGARLASAGDLDGDGLGDIVVGAPRHDAGGTNTGAVYVFTTPPAGTVYASAADAKLTGSLAGTVGYATAGAGDVDGDGLDDLLVGVYDDDTAGSSAGAAYLVGGGLAGESAVASSYTARVLGDAASDLAGTSVAGAGDVDGDGFADFLVGAYGNDAGGSRAGASCLRYGPVSGSVSLSSCDAVFVGAATDDLVGFAVATAGDVDGDGFSDLLIPAYADDTVASDAGAIHLWYGRPR